MYQQNKSESKVKFRQASNLCKRVLQSARLAYATKTKGSVPSHKLIKIKSGSDCIPVVVLKNCEPELSYKLAELFSVCLNLVFQIVGRSHLWSLYLRVLEKGLQLKTKVFEKVVNNRIVNPLEKCGHFSSFQYGFRFP